MMTTEPVRKDMKKLNFTNGFSRRRTFIKTLGLAGGALLLPAGFLQAVGRTSARRRRRLVRSQVAGPMGALPGGTLDPKLIPKYSTPLFQLPEMPLSGTRRDRQRGPVDYYEIAVRQFRQQVLPPALPATTVWGYGSLTAPGTAAQGGSFHAPGFSIEGRWNSPVRVKWINDLKDPLTTQYLPPLLPVDSTLHWANPPGPRDSRSQNPTLYNGPVPQVIHLHGGHTDDDSDGFPEAWYLPAASNIPPGFSAVGSWHDYFKEQFYAKHGVAWEPGTATYHYRNDQRATALWYHGHSLGDTRVNMYAGLAGFYLLRGGPGDQVDGLLPGESPPRGRQERNGSSGSRYEIPLIIQDRSFNLDGSLFYPHSRLFFDAFAGPYIPFSDISPVWNAEFFGNTIMVNGHTWPYLRVERRRYRFRVLNACNSRFLILKFENGLPFWQIGSDGGFLPEPVIVDQLLLAPSERADVIVDFGRTPVGAELLLLNLAPDEPFGGGTPGVDFALADVITTGQVMQFRVVPATGVDTSTPPNRLRLPSIPRLGTPEVTRRVSFNELDSEVLTDVGPRVGLLGTVNLADPANPKGIPREWMDSVTENPVADTTEVWEIFNFTEDAHPFHIHQVEFEVLNREVFDPTSPAFGEVRQPEPWETGRKDSLIVFPGEITRLKAHFDLVGRYVWHCHILEHEDNEMMRPYEVLPN